MNIIGYYAIIEVSHSREISRKFQDMEGVERWFNGMRKMGVNPDPITYARVIKFYAHLKDTPKVSPKNNKLGRSLINARASHSYKQVEMSRKSVRVDEQC